MRTYSVHIALGTILVGVVATSGRVTLLSDIVGRNTAKLWTGKMQGHVHQLREKGTLMIEASIVSPRGRVPRHGEKIRLRGTIEWRNVVPPMILLSPYGMECVRLTSP